MPEVKEACRVCWNASNHKRKPQVTLVDQTIDDKKKKTRYCKVCKHVWNTVAVVEGTGGRWVSVRSNPPVPRREYELCNTWRQGRCVKGSQCSFAHSQEELDVWNDAKYEEIAVPVKQPRQAVNIKLGNSTWRPRPPNPQPTGEYRMCMHMQSTGACPYDVSCHYAHSIEELDMWNTARNARERESQAEVAPETVAVTSVDAPKPRSGIRKRPPLAYTNAYKMCMHVEKGNRCMFGNGCIFAHSSKELEEWNEQLKEAAKQSRSRQAKVVAPPSKLPPPQRATSASSVGAESGAGEEKDAGKTAVQMDTEFPPLLANSDSVEAISLTSPGVVGATDAVPRAGSVGVTGSGMGSEMEASTDDPPFVAQVREELANSGIKIEQLIEDKNGVEIIEFNNRPLSVVWNSEDLIEWNLHVTVNNPQTLSNVVLLDARFPEFRISGVEFATSGKAPKQILQNCNLMGIALMKKLNTKDFVDIKVIFRPNSGFFTQTVVFKFEGFFIGRILAVKMLGENSLLKDPLIGEGNFVDPDLSSRSLFWESEYQIFPFSKESLDEPTLPAYPLPEDVEGKLRSSAYDDMDKNLTMENYRERMHQLLYIEEYQRRMDFSRYDFYDFKIHFQAKYEEESGGIDVALEGEIFIELKLNELLIESSSSIRRDDRALIRPVGESRAFECLVFKVMREKIILRVKLEVQEAVETRQNKADIRFTLNRVPFRCMHHGIDSVELTIIFPSDTNVTVSDPVELTQAMSTIDRELNLSQAMAVKSILHPTLCFLKVPSLICGPFGTGKTRTMREALFLLLARFPSSRILICTHSNSAADLYVDTFGSLWQEKHKCRAPLVRLYYKERKQATIPVSVRPYTRLDTPSVTELSSYRIVVTTTVTSYGIASSIPKGFFTHVFIDEAAQAMEAEALIPLMTVTPGTKLVLAGDYMQLEPPVQSDLARKCNLQRSLLERLYDLDVYKRTVQGVTCRSNLTQNYRSVPEIIDLASNLFYNNELKAERESAFFGRGGIAPLRFVGVKGTEEREEDSPSFFNAFEATEVANQVKELCRIGVDLSDICVLTPYVKQVQRIRYILRQKRCGQVLVHRIENVQGCEYRALILSTVRTCTEVPEDIGHESLGFLCNPKLFNTAVTRAKDYLIVVGDPYTLASVGENRLCWIEFIGRCRHMKSFIFRDNDEFERTLEASIQTRHLAQVATSSPLLSQGPAKVTPQTLENFQRASSRARNNVLTQYLYPLVRQTNESLSHPITGKLLELELEEVFYLLTSPPALSQRVLQIARDLRNPQFRNQPSSGHHPVPQSLPSPPSTSVSSSPYQQSPKPIQPSPPPQPQPPPPLNQLQKQQQQQQSQQPIGQPQQPEKSVTAHINVRGQSVLFLLQLQLDCLNEHERQLNAELQRVRPLSPFSTSTLETLLQQQLHLLQQQKAAVQKQYHLYRGYVAKTKQEGVQQQQPYQSVQRTQPASFSGVSASLPSSVAYSSNRSAFPVPNLGTSIGQQQQQQQQQQRPSLRPSVQAVPVAAATAMVTAALQRPPLQPVSTLAPSAQPRSFFPPTFPPPVQQVPSLPSQPQQDYSRPGHPGAIGSGRQSTSSIINHPAGVPSYMQGPNMPFVYGQSQAAINGPIGSNVHPYVGEPSHHFINHDHDGGMYGGGGDDIFGAPGRR